MPGKVKKKKQPKSWVKRELPGKHNSWVPRSVQTAPGVAMDRIMDRLEEGFPEKAALAKEAAGLSGKSDYATFHNKNLSSATQENAMVDLYAYVATYVKPVSELDPDEVRKRCLWFLQEARPMLGSRNGKELESLDIDLKKHAGTSFERLYAVQAFCFEIRDHRLYQAERALLKTLLGAEGAGRAEIGLSAIYYASVSKLSAMLT